MTETIQTAMDRLLLYPDMNLQKRTQQNTTRYRTALYLRLSREDGDKTAMPPL